MANSNPKPLPSGISLGDITYVLFKHKWKIMLCTLLCAAGAGAYFWKAKPPYVSEAELMIRYLVDNSVEDDINTKVGTGAGRQMDGVVDGQLAIVTSWDVASVAAARTAAELAGIQLAETDSGAADASQPPGDETEYKTEAERVYAAIKKLSPELGARLQRGLVQLLAEDYEPVPQGTRDATKWLLSAAATSILKHLTATTERGTAVIQIAFRHRDESVPQRLLRNLINAYRVKHLEIHRPVPTGNSLTKAGTDSTLAQKNAYEALQKTLSNLKISSIAEGQQLYGPGLAMSLAEFQKADADLEEQKTRVAELEKGLPVPSASQNQDGAETPAGETASNTKNAASQPVQPVTDKQDTPAAPPAAAVPEEPAPIDSMILNNYRDILQSLSIARQQHSQDAMKFVPGSEGLRARWRVVQELESKRMAMEKLYPDLAAAAPAVVAGTAAGAPLDISGQKAELAALQVRRETARKRHEELAADAVKFSNALPVLLSMQQELEVAQLNYREATLQEQRWGMDALLKTKSSTPNIRGIQEPTPAIKDDRLRNRIAIGLLAGGPALGVGLALVFGLLLNRTIKRPLEIEEGLGMPLMMSIPYYTKRQRLKSMRPMGAGKATKALQEIESGRGPWEKSHFIHPYAEAVRDRLMMYFEATGNIRKPKLIAVTGYSVGAGTSTVAAGLASSLSEIGEGKVLLVDMSGSQGAAHPFFDGEPAVSITKALRLPGLTNGAANSLTKTEIGENRNLVVARADSPAGGITSIGLRRLMPELKASEFDYIVFDMPPLGQTKPTATVAGMMDKVLVVVEAETNTRSDVRRGYRDLVQAGANASVLFNKARTHGPKALAGSIG
jgi:succinoglycan biosynthesis transport protein ExoP